MGLQYSTSVNNARLDAIESTIGVSPKLRIYTGSQPANCAAAASGTLLAEMTLPSDWMAAAASGAKALSGTWQDTSADATGTAGHFRIVDSGGTNAHIQGSVTATGGGGQLELNSTSISSGNAVVVTGFTLTAGNA